jgi:CHAT domain-containing protein
VWPLATGASRVAKSAAMRMPRCWGVLVFVLGVGIAAEDASAAPDPLQVLVDEAEAHYVRGTYQHAVASWQKVAQGLAGRPVQDFVVVYQQGTQVLLELWQLDAARQWSDVEIEATEKVYGATSIETALAIAQRAEIERRGGNLELAGLHLKKAAAMLASTKAVGPLGFVEEHRARWALDLGDLQAALAHAKNALDLAERRTPPSPLATARAGATLGRVEHALGNLEVAERLLQRSVDLERAIYHRTHPVVADDLLGLAAVQLALGKDTAAERNFRTTLVSFRIASEHDGPSVAEAALVSGRLSLQAGNLEGAWTELDYGYRLAASHLGQRHTLALRLGLALASTELGQGKLDGARRRLDGVEAAQASVDANHPLVTERLIVEAHWAEAAKDTGDLGTVLNELGVRVQKLPANHPQRVEMSSLRAALAASSGDVMTARQFAREARELREALSIENDSAVADLLFAEARYGLRAEDTGSALTMLRRAEGIHELRTLELMGFGNESHKRAFLTSLAEETSAIVDLAVQLARTSDDAVELAASTVLRRKGRVLDAVTGDFDVLRRRANEADRDKLTRAAKLRATWSSLLLQGPGALAMDDYRAELGELQSQINVIDSTLSYSTRGFSVPRYVVDAENVQLALPEGSVLLEYARYENRDGSDHYAVFVLSPDAAPNVVDLGSAEVIDREVGELRESLARPDGPNIDTPSSALYRRLLQPVEAAVSGRSIVFIAPDDALNLLPFGALKDAKGRYFLEVALPDYLTSGRDLLSMSEHRPSRQGPWIVADPTFGDYRASQGVPAPLSSVSFPPLEGTKEEASRLQKLLPKASVYTGSDASETRLRQVSAPSILHIATHGFFLESQPGQSSLTRGLDLVSTGEAPKAVDVDDPLLLSGLALSQANQHTSGEDDGILTAAELSTLDLHGTELVVLSACETAVGRIAAGEGVYGLRRSLVAAGSATQVMSLWKVDDAATLELMDRYYQSLLSGKGRAEGLRDAQLAMLRGSGLEHPYYWGAFIVSGDPRPLRLGAPANSSAELAAQGCRCRQHSPAGRSFHAALLGVLALALALRRSRSAGGATRSAPQRTLRPNIQALPHK